MDRPVQLVAQLGGVLLWGSVLYAEEAAPASKRERVISPRVAEILTAAAPKYEPPVSTPTGSETGTVAQSPASRVRLERSDASVPANTIIRLPEYVVTERKPRPLPKYEEVISRRELEKLAMLEFLGPEDGFDRGFLNLFTVAGLWKKIPVLGQIPLAGFMTNEERAMAMYRADREAKAWAEAMSLLTPAERAGIATPTGSAPPKK